LAQYKYTWHTSDFVILEMSKSRGWTFTLNNYTTEDIDHIKTLECEYLFQEETGESGTKHLQGMLYYKNAVAFNSVRNLLPRAHIEKMKNKIASIKYCSKEDTRTGEIYSNFNLGDHIGTTTHSVNEEKKVYQDPLEKSKEKLFRELYGDKACDYMTLKKLLMNEFHMNEQDAIDKAFKEIYMGM